MDKILREHQTNQQFKVCVYFGNNSALIKKLLNESYAKIEEIEYKKDEKYGMQMANFIWKQNDLSTYCHGLWEYTNTKLK